MSRGFVKEEDQEEVPLVPPRADLPDNTDNLVTLNGYEELLLEKEELLKELHFLDPSNEKEYRIHSNYLNAKLSLLHERINSAKIIDPKKLPENQVNFGSVVTVYNEKLKQEQTFQIVGVDEAKITKGKISFITPLAKILLQRKLGEQVTLKIGSNETTFKIIKISN